MATTSVPAKLGQGSKAARAKIIFRLVNIWGKLAALRRHCHTFGGFIVHCPSRGYRYNLHWGFELKEVLVLIYFCGNAGWFRFPIGESRDGFFLGLCRYVSDNI